MPMAFQDFVFWVKEGAREEGKKERRGTSSIWGRGIITEFIKILRLEQPIKTLSLVIEVTTQFIMPLK
jgi:hypothetical protein